MPASVLTTLRALGFDRSRYVAPGHYAVSCSQCQTLVINGHPCHETGCPHDVHECRGCSNLIPVHDRYCADCA
jgi:hypothetical protein